MDINEYTSQYFRGKRRLWPLFWFGFVVVFVVLLGVVFFAGGYAIRSNVFMDEWLQWVLLVYIIYIFWVLMSLWRCAFNVKWRGWGYLVRLLVILVGGVNAVVMLSPFFVSVG